MEIINCTPHSIHLHTKSGVRIFKRSGIIPRLSSEIIPSDPIDGIETVKIKYGKIENLPEYKNGTYLIVSSMILSNSDRPDIISPDTGDGAVRNEHGLIMGTTRFVTNN